MKKWGEQPLYIPLPYDNPSKSVGLEPRGLREVQAYDPKYKILLNYNNKTID